MDAAGSWRIAVVCPKGTRFSVPANGFENERLRDAKAAAAVSTVWVAYRDKPGVGWAPL